MTPTTSRLTSVLAASIFAVLAAAPASAGFTCHGTEPFWDLTANKGIVFNSANFGTTRYPKATLTWTGATRLYKASSPGKPAISVAVRPNASCSDGMSDDIFPYEVTVSVKGQRTVQGCCRKW